MHLANRDNIPNSLKLFPLQIPTNNRIIMRLGVFHMDVTLPASATEFISSDPEPYPELHP